MIKCRCATPTTVLLTDMIPFQGDLKKRTDRDIADLCESLLLDGLIHPFSLWKKPDEDKRYILDGHGRREALIKLSLTDPGILQQEFPLLEVEAENEEEAQKALLQISSTYGKITRKGIIHFTKNIPEYKAPIIRHHAARVSTGRQVEPDSVIVRLKVPKSIVPKLTELLKQVDGVEVY